MFRTTSGLNAHWTDVWSDRALSAFRLISLIHVCREYGPWFERVLGPSMEPTIKDHDILLSEAVTPLFWPEHLKRGDLVEYVRSDRPDLRGVYFPYRIIKRVKGLPGDIIEWRPPTASIIRPLIHIPKGHVWLEGDNPAHSTDSRMHGPQPFAAVKRKEIAIVWPPQRMRWL